jgi:hypothetical protein
MRPLVLAALAVLSGVGTEPTSSPTGDAERSSRIRSQQSTPIVVELFTSEGCSSCPPADRLLAELAATQPIDGAQIVALGQHVDYWDQLGWKDRFSSPALTNRQQRYAARFNNESVYTPQMVVDGRTEFVGSDAPAARRAIGRALSVRHGVLRLEVTDASPALRVLVTASALPRTSDHADVVVAVTEDHLTSDVRRGENQGRTLTHAAVVREMTTVGEAKDGTFSAETSVAVAPDWQRDRLTVVGFVQARRDRAILASAAVPLRNVEP